MALWFGQGASKELVAAGGAVLLVVKPEGGHGGPGGAGIPEGATVYRGGAGGG